MQPSLLFETLFKRNSSEAGNEAFLLKLAREHPYFSPAHFFLLQQTPEQHDSFRNYAAKSSLFFDNPAWLNFQLRQPAEARPTTYSEPEEEISSIAVSPETVEPVTESAPLYIESADDHSSIVETPQPIEQVNETAPVHIERVDELISIVAEPEAVEADQETAPAAVEPEPLPQLLKIRDDNKTLPVEAMLFEPMHMVDYFASQGIKLSEEVQAGDKLGKQLKSFTEWLKMMKKVNPMNPGSSLAGNIRESGSEQTDNNIQSIAEKSNTEDDVITEAMAEVLIKQGKASKAIEIYQKLSLLNPPKSAFFAAKIDQLKGI